MKCILTAPPVSVITDQPYGDGPIGTLIPGSLKTVGDLPQWMSLLAPRPLRGRQPGPPPGGNRSERVPPAES
ncbi:MAG: hypothetical protein CM1200mP2_27920 [Planctomycetaceae bacterium]|nr:MAG: hypothetical protein CM1200mP2_27920 [Planctomycetaceae bacterium]